MSKTKPQTKPREFWFNFDFDLPATKAQDHLVWTEKKSDDQYHVIEYSALLAAQNEILSLRDEVRDAKMLANEACAGRHQWRSTELENQKLTAQLEDAKQGLRYCAKGLGRSGTPHGEAHHAQSVLAKLEDKK